MLIITFTFHNNELLFMVLCDLNNVELAGYFFDVVMKPTKILYGIVFGLVYLTLNCELKRCYQIMLLCFCAFRISNLDRIANRPFALRYGQSFVNIDKVAVIKTSVLWTFLLYYVRNRTWICFYVVVSQSAWNRHTLMKYFIKKLYYCLKRCCYHR